MSLSMGGPPIRKVTPYFSATSRQVFWLKCRSTTISPPTYRVGFGPPECSPPRWNQGDMFMVRSWGLKGKCMMTSWAERTSLMLLRGTPLGSPVVPEV